MKFSVVLSMILLAILVLASIYIIYVDITTMLNGNNSMLLNFIDRILYA